MDQMNSASCNALHRCPSDGTMHFSESRSIAFQIKALANQQSLTTRIRDKFLAWSRENARIEPCSDFHFLVQFFHYMVQQSAGEAAEPDNGIVSQIILEVMDTIASQHLKGQDIHVRAAETCDAGADCERDMIRSYTEAMVLSKQPFPQLERAIFASESPMFTVFGGQGNSTRYFDELRHLHATYGCLVDDVFRHATLVFADLLRDRSAAAHYQEGLDFMQWLRKSEATPRDSYLLSAPVSFPLIGLIQLSSYFAACKIWNTDPKGLAKKLYGSTGHSQGIIVAASIATCATWSDFQDAVKFCLTALFYIGCRSQQHFPSISWQQSAVTIKESPQNDATPGDDAPQDVMTPMMNILQIPRKRLEAQIRAFNQHLREGRQVFIALVNAPKNIVVGGPPESLRALWTWLSRLPGTAQNRKDMPPDMTARFLPVSAPFHTPYLAAAYDQIILDLEQRHIGIKPETLLVPVYDTVTGFNLQKSVEEDLVSDLVKSVTTDMVDWPLSTATMPDESTIIDFGPGATSGIGTLVQRSKDGTGTQVILAGPSRLNMTSHTEGGLGCRTDLFRSTTEKVSRPGPVHWGHDLSLGLVMDKLSGRTMLDTRMTRILGLPPLMVGGMTPTTTHPDLVAACVNAGYHVEMACGGYFNEIALTDGIRTLLTLIPVGRRITLNLIYSAPRQIGWQVPLIRKLNLDSRAPSIIEGIALGAGVPSLDVASSYITGLGLKHIAFKPGNLEAMRQVITIAQTHPNFPVILQWTGGRGGGHHSDQDFHGPLLEMYAGIRRCPNIILVVGSGFGGTHDTYPYLTGSWSESLGQPRMPCDGILFGSRMMIAKEAHTSLEAKQLIAATAGVDDSRWHLNPEVITVKSEMGQPIHKIATRGVRFWADLDKTVFCLPKDKQVQVLAARRKSIIERLNKDFQKVWFGVDFKTGEAAEIVDMTYADVTQRLVNLLFLSASNRWIDASYAAILGDFVRRIEERLSPSDSCGSRPTFTSYAGLITQEPYRVMGILEKRYAECTTQLVHPEDLAFFQAICHRSGQKPVPFILDLDAQFETWFKKDSLWQSEFVEALVDGDVQRACILQGPVAVGHVTERNIDESAKTILDTVHDGLVEMILQQNYRGLIASVPQIELLGHSPLPNTIIDGTQMRHVQVIEDSGLVTIHIDPAVPGEEQFAVPSLIDWFDLLAVHTVGWSHALFKSTSVKSGTKMIVNPFRTLFSPAPGVTITIAPDHINLSNASDRDGNHQLQARALLKSGSSVLLRLYCHDNPAGAPLALELRFTYHPETAFALIHEEIDEKMDRITDFYRKIWVAVDSTNDPASPHLFQIRRSFADKFHKAIGGAPRDWQHDQILPMDIAIIAGWHAMSESLLSVPGDKDYLSLVHLSNKIRVLSSAPPFGFRVGDEVESTAKTTSVSITKSGKVVEILCVLSRLGDDQPVLDVTSRFLFRGQYDDHENSFTSTKQSPTELILSSIAEVNMLLSLPWITLSDMTLSAPERLCGRTLLFELETHHTADIWRTSGEARLKVPDSGTTVAIASVHCESKVTDSSFSSTADDSPSSICPVMRFLARHAVRAGENIPPAKFVRLHGANEPAFVFTAPSNSASYSHISHDFNPIHVSRVFARCAGLSGPIVHGMQTSAIVRNLCANLLHRGGASPAMGRMREFNAVFSGMIVAGEDIGVHLELVAASDGCDIVKVEARRTENEEKVFEGECVFEPVETTYLFTGQGSQEVGMGMDLYKKSPTARAVWDRADNYFEDAFGFRISDIVRKNPKVLTIHFGGKRGGRIRQNYLDMASYEKASSPVSLGVPPAEQKFLSITQDSSSHTFFDPAGLLFSTQFAQPALIVFEKAAYEEMKSRHLISDKSSYAGHSLGEYAALCSIAELMPFEHFLSIVFYRGLTMGNAVSRDSEGRTDFGMVAVDPSRIMPGFKIKQLEDLVTQITEETDAGLLEVVNYNVQDRQYVCAGTSMSLRVLTEVCNTLHHRDASTESISQTIASAVSSSLLGAGSVPLVRGTATIPLVGIDIPFHSSHLKPKLDGFRKVLERRIRADTLQPAKLVGKYVPNVTARPFGIAKDDFEHAWSVTGSEVLRELLDTAAMD